MGQAPSQRDGLGTEFRCLFRKARNRQVDRPGAVSAHAGIMTTEGEREGMMPGAVISRYALLSMHVRSGQFAAPKRRPPLRVMTLKREIIGTQALREPEKLVGMSVRFVQVSGDHRIVPETPQRLEPRRAVLARLESHGAAIDAELRTCRVRAAARRTTSEKSRTAFQAKLAAFRNLSPATRTSHGSPPGLTRPGDYPSIASNSPWDRTICLRRGLLSVSLTFYRRMVGSPHRFCGGRRKSRRVFPNAHLCAYKRKGHLPSSRQRPSSAML